MFRKDKEFHVLFGRCDLDKRKLQSSTKRCTDQLHITTRNKNTRLSLQRTRRQSTQHGEPDSRNRDTVPTAVVQKNTRSLTSDDKIHELIQELGSKTDIHRKRNCGEEKRYSLGYRRGTAIILIRKRWSKHIKEVQHS